jgi:acid phosphatase
MAALLGFFQIAEMVWPGMGSEVRVLSSSSPPDPTCNRQVVFELYSSSNSSQSDNESNDDSTYFVRVLWGGQPLVTTTPLGTLDQVPIQDFYGCKP